MLLLTASRLIGHGREPPCTRCAWRSLPDDAHDGADPLVSGRLHPTTRAPKAKVAPAPAAADRVLALGRHTAGQHRLTKVAAQLDAGQRDARATYLRRAFEFLNEARIVRGGVGAAEVGGRTR